MKKEKLGMIEQYNIAVNQIKALSKELKEQREIQLNAGYRCTEIIQEIGNIELVKINLAKKLGSSMTVKL